ncbi:MAG TPA: YraN family protein [Kiritimatiellia bacterium]|nr:YraN family protein [Kiritimatiellia bacterium]
MNLLRKWLKREPAHLAAGVWGEQQAERFLCKRGFTLVGRRIRVGRDELDLVMRKGPVLVFVEVKTRGGDAFGRPFDAVDRAKQLHLSRAAVRYLMNARIKPEYIRFDVVEVIGAPDGEPPRIEHIENAFPLSSRYRLPW